MWTAAAARVLEFDLTSFCGVASRRELAAMGIDATRIEAQVAARRWQLFGAAVVLHNARPDRGQWHQVARINCGPRAVLTSFTAAEEWGLEGWSRPTTHVLAPAGTRRPAIRGLVLHRVGTWDPSAVVAGRGLHRLPPALVLAASSFAEPRSGCGLLAAAVQQRLVQPEELHGALDAAPRTRHRAALLAAVADIAQGADALSEIDFVRLCLRHRLPTPAHQAVRTEPNGRRRYLDAEWRLDGRVVAAEVDGALHLSPRRWAADQLRQNELVIGGTVVLRFPSVVVRTEERLVADQLRRVLGLHERS